MFVGLRNSLLVSLLLITPKLAFACSCAPIFDADSAVQRYVSGAERVFVGKVLGQTAIQTDEEYAHIVESELAVAWSWKGATAKTVTLRINVQCCVCGLELKLDEEYLIFAYERSGRELSASSCTSRHIDRASNLIDALNRKFPDGAWSREPIAPDSESQGSANRSSTEIDIAK